MDLKEGPGLIRLKDGSKLFGEYENNLLNGKGLMTNSNGDEFVVQLINSKIVEKTPQYIDKRRELEKEEVEERVKKNNNQMASLEIRKPIHVDKEFLLQT